jgi:hypothetical protein
MIGLGLCKSYQSDPLGFLGNRLWTLSKDLDENLAKYEMISFGKREEQGGME